MRLQLTPDPIPLAAAIDAFDERYHRDYLDMRPHARAYLESPRYASVLVPWLQPVLRCWGAERRRAPRCRPMHAAAEALADPVLHDMLRRLAASRTFLAMQPEPGCGRRRLAAGSPFATAAHFDQCLLAALRKLAAGLFYGATNVTYPMKVLLLITGLMPALDGRVRGGMATAGLSGVGATSLPLPDRECANARKLCMLPFLVAECAARNGALLDAAIAISHYPQLAGEYGRVFDVLLFMQHVNAPAAPIVRYVEDGTAQPWYRG